MVVTQWSTNTTFTPIHYLIRVSHYRRRTPWLLSKGNSSEGLHTSAQNFRWLPNATGRIQWPTVIYTRMGAWLTSRPYPGSHTPLPRLTSHLHWVLTPLKALVWASFSLLLPFQYRSLSDLLFYQTQDHPSSFSYEYLIAS